MEEALHEEAANGLMQYIDTIATGYIHPSLIAAAEHNASQWPANLFFVLAMLVLLVACAMLVGHIVRLLARREPVSRRHNRRKKAFKWWAFATFVAGYLLYLVGFYWEEGTKGSVLACLFRPLLSSLEMFVSHSDLIEVDIHCKENAFYMALFSMVHFSAVAISASFAINCFWGRIVYFLRRLWWMVRPAQTTVNVFFGLDERTLMLAKDLYGVSERSGHRERMVFVDMPGEEHAVGSRLSFSHVFGLFSYKSEQMRALNKLKPLLMHSSLLPHKLDEAGTDILDELEIQVLRRFIRTAPRVRLFFLAGSEPVNLKAMLNVLCDGVFSGLRSPVAVYCRARNNVVNRSVRGIPQAEIHLVDEASLSVAALKLMPLDGPAADRGYKAHPIRWTETDPQAGCVTSAFTALIIGFGATGQEALRFVYEFGAFPGPDGRKSPFKCCVIDRHMEAIRGEVLCRIPALRDLGDEIELIQETAGSQAFWDRLNGGLLDALNYVVIAMGNDEADIALAAELCRHAGRYRKNGLERLGIFVRSYEAENGPRLQRIAAYCNETQPELMTIFGSMGEIYTRRMIIDNGLLQLAKTFYERYNRTSPTPGPSWEERHEQCLQGAGGRALTLRKQGLYRKEFEDVENSLHTYTKARLIDAAYLKQALPTPREFSFEHCPSGLDRAFYRCLVNVSIGEHLRWNASHFMLGYVPMPVERQKLLTSSCDEQTKQHKYLCDWEVLDEDTRRYDYAVVYTACEERLKHLSGQR